MQTSATRGLCLLLCLVAISVALPWKPKANTCGYDSCAKTDPNKINVHLVPHSHDDVGWLKTVDQYYYGSKSNIQWAGVQYILDSVVSELQKDPARRFIQVESAFFFQWWAEQTEETQAIVKDLVNQGRLEFIGGAWSMNDEATTIYQTTIDNFSWGLRRINDSFGSCGRPRIGWQIDPFGHSREQASLMAQYNFDGLFFARADYQDRAQKLKTKTMEVMWEADPTLGKQSDLLTGYLYGFYGNPSGFCFDVYCQDEPIIDNPNLADYNVPARVGDFVKAINDQKQYFTTNNIMFTMGGDFQYMDAAINFKNMDKLIKATNALNPDINVIYSTPSCYVKALNEAGNTWTTKQDDFFPYGSGERTYWTGYFTSRPTLKRFERLANNILQAGKQLATVGGVDAATANKLDAHREAQGILQHHDAVAGTEKQAVAEDYARILNIGVSATNDVISTALNKFLLKNAGDAPVDLSPCLLRNISQCAVTESKESFLVTLYNPLSRTANVFTRFPVADAAYSVTDPDGKAVVAQVLTIPDQLAKIPGREAKTTKELLFEATDLPPLGYKSYYVTRAAGVKPTSHMSKVWTPTGTEDVYLGNEKFGITLDGKTKKLKSIKSNREIYDTVQGLEYYIGALGDNGAEDRRSSGAYIFRPTTDNSSPIKEGEVNTTVVQGDLGFEVHQTFDTWASQIIRHFYDEQDVDNSVEFEWLVGPIPTDDGNGREIISKFKTNLKTDGVFVTDSSGRNDLVRKRDFRPTWDLQVHEPVAGNYYPVVLDMYIDNGTDRLAVITDRAQGGSSIHDGELEIMVHRRLLHDDAFGVGEALNEEAFGTGLVAKGTHYVVVGPTADVTSTRNLRLLAEQRIMDTVPYFTDVTGKKFADVQKSFNLKFSGLTAALPDEVQILTLEPWRDGTVLLRLENIFTADEQSSGSVTVDLSNLFSTFTVTSARETTLAGNQWIEEATRLQWKKQGSDEPTPGQRPTAPLDIKAVTLTPKQIRTFVVNVKNA